MQTIVLDSFAILTWFRKQNSWEKVEDILLACSKQKIKCLLNIVNYTEIAYQIIRQKNQAEADSFLLDLQEIVGVKIVNLDLELCNLAATFKAKGNIALPDCFVLATAKKYQAEIWTGDMEFRQFESEVKIFWL
jgi:predicted nucleic acid-binding protein